MLGMPKRGYWNIIKNVEPSVLSMRLKTILNAVVWRTTSLTQNEIEKANLGAYRKAYRQEAGLRMALKGGMVVNILYFIIYHLLFRYFSRQLNKVSWTIS